MVAPPVVQWLHREFGPKAAGFFAQKPITVIADPVVSHAGKSVYDAVAFFAWRSNGKCQESAKVIGALCNVSTRQVKSCLAVLEERGHIERRRVSRWRPDVFTIVQARPEAISPGPVEVPGEEVRRPPAKNKVCGHRIAPSDLGICQMCKRVADGVYRLREARAELGPEASKDELYVRVNTNRKTFVQILRADERMRREEESKGA